MEYLWQNIKEFFKEKKNATQRKVLENMDEYVQNIGEIWVKYGWNKGRYE